MKDSIKWLAVVLILFFVIFVSVDKLLCNKWKYHDYAAGIDRSLSCFWN